MKTMKKILFITCALIVAACSGVKPQTQVIKAIYPEETELVAVVSHLADVAGYVWDEDEMSGMKFYFDEVDSTFAQFRNHEIIPFIQDSLYYEGFNWDFPMRLALRLGIENGKIVYDDTLAEEEEYYENITRDRESKFIELLQDFYDESDFHGFYVNHKPLYEECENAMQEIIDQVDFGWYESFFGPRENSSFHIYVGLLCGPGNYAIHQKGKTGSDIVNSVIGCANKDENGIYYGLHYTLPIIIHECNHSYCNPLNEEFWSEIEAKMNEFFEPNAEYYADEAYGAPGLVANETFVEASVMRYLYSHPLKFDESILEKYRDYFDVPNASEDEIRDKYYERLITVDEVNKKFYMIRDIIDVLAEREAEMDKYPTMKDFMPRYIETINSFTQE